MSVREFSALLAVCLILAGVVLTARYGGIRVRGDRGMLLRYVAVAAVTAALSTLMALGADSGAPLLARALNAGTTVLAPAVVWVALRRLNGGTRAAMLVALAPAVVAAAAVPLWAGAWAGAVHNAALVAVCALLFLETGRGRVRALAGAALVRIVAVCSALLSLARIVTGFVVGEAAVFLPAGVLTQVSMVSRLIGIALLAAGIARMIGDLGRDEDPARAREDDLRDLRAWVAACVDRGDPVILCTLSLPDLPLIRVAHGGGRAVSIEQALCRAVREAAPDGVPMALVAEGTVLVPVRVGSATAARAERLRRRFEELTPLVAYEDLPEIHIERTDVTTVGDLDALLRRVSPRRSRWAGTGRRPAG